MEGKESNNCRSGDGFIDRSKVRILLCDNDAKSSEEVFTLLLKCSYQVTSVRSARQVIDALNAEGPDIDIILAEVDLPMNKGMKMLKYITRDKELRRIPVIMMSAQDEVSIVVKCLRLGAADYLVKPLRTNELLNLWTHMWRRRRMQLGLGEKNVVNYDFDLVLSDPSDANTNSTNLFSDDTDDKSRKSTNPEMGISVHAEDESLPAPLPSTTGVPAPASAPASDLEPLFCDVSGYRPDVPGISERRTGQLSSGPKKSELKIGESSAFFTYVKSSTVKTYCQGVVTQREQIATQSLRREEKIHGSDPQLHENGEAWESHSQGDDFRSSTSVPDSFSLERSSTPPMSTELHQRNFKEDNQGLMHPRNDRQVNGSGLSTQSAYPCFMSGLMNQVMMPASSQLYQKNVHELQTHASPGMLPQYSHLPHCPPHMSGMPPFPYYPVGLCLQPGQMPTPHSWPSSFGSCSSAGGKANNLDRREAALIKFRKKRKERCFDKKIRYVNRKKLAERRPRVRGQFVRKLNGVNVDLNGQPAPADSDEDEDDDDDEHASTDSSPENDVSGS